MKIKELIFEILIVFLISLLIIFSSEPIIRTDSARYLNGSLIDPPFYSNFILITKLIFGSLNSVVILQTTVIGFSIIFFVRTLHKHFSLNLFNKIFISLILYFPIIQFYDYILTEPISYALTIIFISNLINLIYTFNIKNLTWVSFSIILLLLTRNQFLFLYPYIFFIFVGIFIIGTEKNKFKLLLISIVGIFFIHNSIIILNTYLKKDKIIINEDFGVPDDYNLKIEQNWTEKLTYVNVGPSYFTFIDSIYISNIKDVELFNNHNIKKTLINIFNEMDANEALINYYDGRGHFGLSLEHIRDYSYPLLLKLSNQLEIPVSELRREIAIKLISKNFNIYIKHLYKKFYDSTWLFVFIPFLILLSSLKFFLKNKSKISLVIFSVSSFVLMNHMIVYLFGRIQPRYLIYSDIILLIFVYLLVTLFLENEVSRNKKI